MQAAEHNQHVIQQHGSVDAAIKAQNQSICAYGSEFRPTSVLHQLMRRHPLWIKIEIILNNGTTFPLRPINENDRRADIVSAMKYGNHKSVLRNQVSFTQQTVDEIEQGWALPLPPKFAFTLQDAEVAPHGLVLQNTITEHGEIVEKDRITHDQSYPGSSSKESINSRVIEDELTPCMFGHMHLRCIHYIVGCRQRHPSTNILISKIDWKSAYRRQHLNGSTATKSLTQVIINGITFLIMALRLTFGGKPNPSEWSCLSEATTDLANDILSCQEWDPDKLKAPIQDMMPKPSSLPSDIPHATAKQTIVNIPAEDQGKCDVYIDDTVAMGPDIPGNKPRLAAAVPLAIHLLSRPIISSEDIPRKPPISIIKLRAEGRLEETKTLLGWFYDTRRLRISLPSNKFKAWSNQVRDLIKSRQTSFSALDTLIGRLNHAAYVIPTARHFMSRIRSLKTKARFKQTVSIPRLVTADLALWLDFLQAAHVGISMNLLTYRQPTHVYRSDACEHGLGGYSSTGKAWRLHFPNKLLGRAHINLLEFLASIICIWLDIIDEEIPVESCLLAMGDNTSATGWLRRTNFQSSDEDDHDNIAKTMAARHLARLLQHASSMLYSQWFPGDQNDVSDSLSRDNHLSNSQLHSMLNSHVPSQLTPNFRIVELPLKIRSWVFSLLEKMPVKTQRQVKHKISAMAISSGGPNSCTRSASNTTTSSPNSQNPGQEHFSSQPSPKQCVRHGSPATLSIPWLKAQSVPPWTTWHRPSGLTTGQTHAQMTMGDSTSFFSSSIKATRIKMETSNNKRHSLSVSFANSIQ